MTEDATIDGRLGHDAAGGGVIPFLRKHLLDLNSVLTDDHLCTTRDVVWSRFIRDAIEPERITTGGHDVAGRHTHVLLSLISGDERHADDEHRHTQMCDLHSVVAATLRAQFLKRVELTGSDANSLPEVHDDRGDDPDQIGRAHV